MTVQRLDMIQRTASSDRRRIGIACNDETRKLYLHPDDLRRLERLGQVDLEEYDVTGRDGEVLEDPEVEDRFISFAADLDVLLLGRGAPRVSQRVLAASPRLKLVGEIEGDRFSRLVDVPAATNSGVLIVDTTHASSGPVAEWALALALVGLRQHARFRDIIGGQDDELLRLLDKSPGPGAHRQAGRDDRIRSHRMAAAGTAGAVRGDGTGVRPVRAARAG